jgi:hypothetical protein
VVAVIAAYSAYWVLTPTHLQVAGISTSLAQPNEVHVTLHNPTFKIVTGSISRIEALTDIPNGRGGTTILQSVPGDYPFTILPQSSLQLTVPMNSRALPSLDYDLYLHIDWGGSNITTIKMPKS